MTAKQKAPASKPMETIMTELTGELKMLRALVREVGEQFILRREGEIETILGDIATLPARKIREHGPKLLGRVRKLRVKPHKGRVRDLKEIDGLIKDLGELRDEMQAPRPSGARKVKKGTTAVPVDAGKTPE